jgi:hypothetical protein
MPLSTSSSNSRAARWALGAFLAMAVVYLLGLELATRRKLAPISRIHNRMYDEYQVAKTLRPSPNGRTVLLTGSSLLNASIDVPMLNREIGPNGIVVRRWLVESTSYYDWWYGLRRVFSEGARPDEVWLTMAPQEVVTNDYLGEFGAYYVYRTEDLPDLVRTLSIPPTQASGLAVASFSEFYGFRNDIRKVLIGRLLPGFGDLRLLLIGKKPPLNIPSNEVVSRARQRLVRIKELCRQNGANLHYVVPASGVVSFLEEVKEAAKQADVPVWEPAPLGTYSSKDFGDGYHLNLDQSPGFTHKLATMISEP